jgi:hypothetical protein
MKLFGIGEVIALQVQIYRVSMSVVRSIILVLWNIFNITSCLWIGFPEAKELKQLVRDRVSPDKDLGHSDKKLPSAVIDVQDEKGED